MPRLPINYSKTIIYKIVCNDLNITDVYVGSTTDFIRRKRVHKSDCNCETSKNYNVKLYKNIRCNGGWDNFTMIEIEKYNCNDSNEAHARERYYYELLNATLNSQVPIRSNKEYYEDNKEQINRTQKKYYENNKELIKQYKKKYYEDNKETSKKYYEDNKDNNKDKKKKYYENNKEKIQQYNKKYYEENKDKRNN
jgi:hypothetical protein